MTDPTSPDSSYPIPEPSFVDPSSTPVRNGQCHPGGLVHNYQQQPKRPSLPEFSSGQEMKITESVEEEGS